MSKLYVALLAAFSTVAAAQGPASRWEGVLATDGALTAVGIALTQSANGWSATFSLPAEGVRDMSVPTVAVRGDSVLLTLRPGVITFAGVVRGDSLAGTFVNSGRQMAAALGRVGSPVAQRLAERVRVAQEKTSSARGALELTERGPGVVDSAALARLIDAAKASHTDALVVMRNGALVGAWHTGGRKRPIEAMSATKSIVNLAIGRLVTTGKIASLDLPVSTWYPEYRDGRKAKITLRNLLDHTSGMKANPTTEEIYSSKDFVRLALDADIVDEPGSRFFYNNKATNLVAGVVEKASGKKLDDYLRGDLFVPMGITDFAWTRDASGNPHGMAGFQAHAEDLAKLGQLLLQRGEWNGQRLLSTAFVDESLRPTPKNATYGLLWWLIPEWIEYVVDDAQIAKLRAANVDSSVVASAATLRGTYRGRPAFIAALQKAFGSGWQGVLAEKISARGVTLQRVVTGPIIGYEANGYLGQYIDVYPAKGIVAVRMVNGGSSYNQTTDGFDTFQELVRALVK